MAHSTNNGSARSVTTQDFNERVKRALLDKHDPQPKAKPAPRRFRSGAPNTAD